MKIFVLCSILFFINACAGDSGRFFNMSSQQIDSLLQVVSARQMTITDRMNYFSEYFLDTPYSFTCVGDGPYALLEQYPLVNFQQTNCMAFCEHLLALSISDSWDNFFNNLQHIRYKDGLIGMRTRNHYTMADWLPENRWLLQDVSAIVAQEDVKQVTRTISHINFFRNKGIKDLRQVSADREITIDYIPSEVLSEIRENLKDGDIGALIFDDKSDIFSAHMFVVLEQNDRLIIRESSNSKMSTFDTDYESWAKSIISRPKYMGIAVMRVRADLNLPGQILYPSQINALKTSSIIH